MNHQKMTQLIALLSFTLCFCSDAFAQSGDTTRSVNMRPGTTAPDMPTNNKIPDVSNDPLAKDHAALKLNASEVQLKRSRWAKPKAKTPKKTIETPNRQR